ncbi:SixA phosphatase family protein [Azospirillum sp. A39]|uniref:SixA phosphatase family protein n=1 Tax=Azospirillum sp. A39 TaxID=3462279 RepID=UPI0040453E3F
MKTLFLLRHAKSAWDDPSLADHDRPLAPRGRKAAPRVGRRLRDLGLRPERALCSTARRAVDTLALVLEALGGDVPVEREHGLYLCGSRGLLERLRGVPGDVGSLMLVAHNPDLHELATELAGAGPAEAVAALRAKFPTGACAVLTFEAADWRAVEPGAGRLVEFMLPRTLA